MTNIKPHIDADPESPTVGWCAQCGPRTPLDLDGDGCCRECGATAAGEGADHAARNAALLEEAAGLLKKCGYPVGYTAGQTQGIDRWAMFELREDIAALLKKAGK